MNLWTIKAKLYHLMRKRSIFQYILQKENENFRSLLNKLPKRDIKILDLGCGDGNIINLLHRHFPHSPIYGLDRSSAMIQNIKKGDKTLLVQGNACKIPFKQNCFELCTVVGLTEYIEDINNFMNNLYGIMKSNGYIIITFSPKNVFTYTRFIHGIKLYPVDKMTITQFITNNGFTIIKKKTSLMQLQYLIKKTSSESRAASPEQRVPSNEQTTL
jgi:ubiquinone/menaquinone biosynthesis C-methylase UbiE